MKQKKGIALCSISYKTPHVMGHSLIDCFVPYQFYIYFNAMQIEWLEIAFI